MQGEADQYGTRAQVDAIAARTNAEVLMVPGAGHAPFRDAPERVHAAIAAFITASR